VKDEVELSDKQACFEAAIMPHLDAAYNLARWLTGNEHDAEDVAQEACLRAYKFFDGFRGGDGRSWLLSIVRNTSYTWLQRNRKPQLMSSLEDEALNLEDTGSVPDLLLLSGDDQQLVRRALEELAPEFREVIVLRELEDLSYKEIAVITQVPIGTVMSRLARARKQLEQELARALQPGGAK
jgi:RNA polymerase sigma-70 factor (ECF subfamily)